MNFQSGRRWGAGLWSLAAILFAGATTGAIAGATTAPDVVTLNSGGVIRGKVISGSSGGSSKTVAVRTATGSLIVVERTAVKQLQQSAPPKHGANASSSKRSLSPGQEAWMRKVRLLVEKLYSGDPEKSRRARSDLLAIDDPDAIAALSRYLQAHQDVEGRRLFIHIVQNMPGPAPVYYLVAASLFDPSPVLREEARKAIGPERANDARPLYINALKRRKRNLASLAAKGISEIGDPRGDAIPYLIDVLTFRTSVEIATDVPRLTLGPADVAPTGPTIGAGGGVVRGVGSRPLPMGTSDGAATGFLEIPAYSFLKPTYGHTEGPADLGSTSPGTTRVREENPNPAVQEALEKLTDRKFGYNRDSWRRWWANEKQNRDLQKSKSEDRARSRPTDAR